MAWVRDGARPEQVKVSFVVSAKEYPELANFILSLPYGATSKILREILSSAVRNASANQADNPAKREVAPTSEAPVSQPASGHNIKSDGNHGIPPRVEDVSSAAAGIIHNFDKMFPS